MLQHGLGVSIGDQKRDVVSLEHNVVSKWDRIPNPRILTCTGFLRSTMKLSARCIINRVNLWQRIRSISSACLIFMLIRIELTEGSIRTRSFSLREIVNGLRRTSFDPLMFGHISRAIGLYEKDKLRCFDLRLVVTFHNLQYGKYIVNSKIKASIDIPATRNSQASERQLVLT